MERKAMSEMRELTDMEVESVCGGVFELPAYFGIGGNLSYGPGGVDPGMTPPQPLHSLHLVQFTNPADL